MKLSSALVKETLSQFQDAEAIPDNHPALPQLNRLFGDHTFFLDSHGLNIVEPVEPAKAGTRTGKVVNLASWSDSNPPSLEPHEPESTDVLIELGSLH